MVVTANIVQLDFLPPKICVQLLLVPPNGRILCRLHRRRPSVLNSKHGEAQRLQQLTCREPVLQSLQGKGLN